MKCAYDKEAPKIVGAMLVNKKTSVVRNLKGVYLGKIVPYYGAPNAVFVPRKTKIND